MNEHVSATEFAHPSTAVTHLNDASDRLSDATDLLHVIGMAETAREQTPESAAMCTAIGSASEAICEARATMDKATEIVRRSGSTPVTAMTAAPVTPALPSLLDLVCEVERLNGLILASELVLSEVGDDPTGARPNFRLISRQDERTLAALMRSARQLAEKLETDLGVLA